MFKIGDKIMVHGFEKWGEGEIKKIYHSDYNDEYTTYFSNMGVCLVSWSQDRFYQTLEQQIISRLSKLPIACEPIKPIIFATSKADDETLKTFSEMKGKIELEINKPNSQFQTLTDLLNTLSNNIKFEFKNGSTIKTITIQNNGNTYRSSGRGFTSDFTFIDEFDPDDINKFFKNTTDKGDFNMPKIKNYQYAEDTAITTIEWSDGTKTTVHAEHPENADPYTGFVTACAKKAFGNNNTINNLFDEWAIKKPAREAEAKAKAEAAKLEEKRITEKRKAKREKWHIRKRATEIAKEYEARKFAHDKYGIPMEDNNT